MNLAGLRYRTSIRHGPLQTFSNLVIFTVIFLTTLHATSSPMFTGLSNVRYAMKIKQGREKMKFKGF